MIRIVMLTTYKATISRDKYTRIEREFVAPPAYTTHFAHPSYAACIWSSHAAYARGTVTDVEVCNG